MRAAWFPRLAALLKLDGAVGYGILLRVWLVVGGLVSMMLVGTQFSTQIQGYYYTFASLLALQSFFELGLSIVVINTASHEWSKLRLGPRGGIDGDGLALARLSSLARMVFKWYGIAAFLFVVCAGIFGTFFLPREEIPNGVWSGPWWALVILTGATLWALAPMAVLDGCGQITVVNRYRLLQAVTSHLGFWFYVLVGAELWAAPVANAGGMLWLLYLLFFRYRHFIRALFSRPVATGLRWQTDIWPLQWRLAVQGIVNYLLYSLFVPVIFHYHGAAAAGQMGLTWQALNGVQSLAMVWVQTTVPSLGMAIAKGQRQEVLRLWGHTSLVSLGVAVAGVAAFLCLIVLLRELEYSFSQRILEPVSVLLLCSAVVLSQGIQCLAALCRAHRQEPFVFAGVTAGLLAGLFVWYGGRDYGPLGAIAGYLAVTGLWALPLALLITWRLLRDEGYRLPRPWPS
jgi:O-antigen/teichoic acid export membrane protein